jgi:hypothetical protein
MRIGKMSRIKLRMKILSSGPIVSLCSQFIMYATALKCTPIPFDIRC